MQPKSCLIYKFTFHYGPIQIWIIKLNEAKVSEFTFHYGPIQIEPSIVVDASFADLHSTMVLFKSTTPGITIIVVPFTFHYGPIQIVAQYFFF